MAPIAPVSQAAAQPDTRPWYAKKRFLIPMGVFGLFILLPLLGSLGDDSTPQDQARSSSSTRTQAVARPSTTSAPTEQASPAEETAETAEAEAPAEEPAMVVTAKQMLDDLEANALAASNKYKGKRVTVTGKLDNIDASGNYFSLKGSEYSFITNITVDIDESFHDIVSGFTTGQDVTVTGIVTDVGEIMGYEIDPESIG